MNRTQKLILLGGVIILIAGFVWSNYRNETEFSPYQNFDAFLDEKDRSVADIERYTKNLEEAYKNDTYGGDTPEETLQLFIDALKKGDTELASKYFIIEEQEKQKVFFQNAKNNGALATILTFLEKPKEGGILGDMRYILATYDENNVREFSYEFLKNPYTNKWKIESL